MKVSHHRRKAVASAVVKDRYHHGALKQALVDRAFRVLERDGLDSLSLRGLAEASGVSKTAPYRHFADKRDLLVTLAAEGFRELAETLEEALHEHQGVPDGGTVPEPPGTTREIRALYRAYGQFALRRPALYRLMFSRLGFGLHSESCRINSRRALGCLALATRAAQAAGWRSNQDPGSLIISLWASIHGWVGLLIDDLLPEDMGVTKENWLSGTESLLDSTSQ
jgi:AcrR family transcriptional regulator